MSKDPNNQFNRLIERLNAKIKNNKKLQLRYVEDITNLIGSDYLFCLNDMLILIYFFDGYRGIYFEFFLSYSFGNNL